mmetsp:Transcript_25975/g.57322  ORF Transcript_25975/g.57322 Transcript_25975/m.57322 type:complete len:85 (-) Transcript_25975:73-327(-)
MLSDGVNEPDKLMEQDSHFDATAAAVTTSDSWPTTTKLMEAMFSSIVFEPGALQNCSFRDEENECVEASVHEVDFDHILLNMSF